MVEQPGPEREQWCLFTGTPGLRLNLAHGVVVFDEAGVARVPVHLVHAVLQAAQDAPLLGISHRTGDTDRPGGRG